MTSHLESTKNYGEARKQQLKQCFEYIKNREADRTVVFGGDLNIRDKEVRKNVVYFIILPLKSTAEPL